MQEQSTGARGIVVHQISVGEGTNMRVQQKSLTVFEQTVGIFEIGLAFADRFDLGSMKGNAALELVQQKVVMACRPIDGGIAVADGNRIARPGGLFGGRGLGRCRCGIRHRISDASTVQTMLFGGTR